MNYARTKRNFGNVRKYLGNMRKTQVCPVCVAKFRHVGQCASHWTECHVNLMYLEKKRTRKRSRVAATFVERAGQFLDRTPWAKGRVLVCRKCHFATNFLSAMREHLDFNSGRCLLPMWAKFDKDTRDALQKRFKFTVVNDNEGLAQYEEMAKLEIDYEADFDDLAFSSRDNLEKYTGCRLSPTPAVHMESSTSLPQTNCPGVHKDFLFFDVALHKRRSGLHGLRRNTSATLCSKCFQVFLEVSAFENHFCLGVKVSLLLNMKWIKT